LEKKDILLINPRYDDFYEGEYFPVFPPLGLAYIASMAQSQSFTVTIYDAAVESENKQQILNFLDTVQAKIVGISVYTPNLRTVKFIVEYIRHKKNTRGFPFIVLGGHHIHHYPLSVFKLGGDFGILGEAETSFTQLCRYLIKKEGSLNEIPGLIYNRDGETFINKICYPQDINQIPFPARNLLNNHKYFSLLIPSGYIGTIIISRGCPFRCNFCANSSFYEYRRRDVKNVLKEIENIISEHRIKYIEFVDDTFTYDYEFVVTLCELLLEKKLSIKWGCQTRADFLNAELLALMRKSGCVKISLGLETAVDKIRAIIGKHIKLETYRNIFKLLKINNIYSMALIMLGLPTERQCDMLKSLKAAKKLADMAIFQLNHVYPGTTHFHELKEKGKITENIWDDYMNYHADYPYYIPEDLSLKQLNLFLKRSYIEFYFRPTYFLKWINKIQSLNQLNNFIKVAKRIFTFKVRFKKQL